MSRRPITRQQFDEVQAIPATASGEYVADKTGLSVSTVRNIRKAKTWEKFEERRVALKRKQSAERAMKPAPRPTPPNVPVTKSVAKPQGVGRIKPSVFTEDDQKRTQTAVLTGSVRAIENRLDRYIKTSNTALEELHRGLADVTKDVADLKKYVADQQKREEREAAKSRRRINNPTFVDRITRRFKS